MYRVLSIERTRREPSGPYGACGGGQFSAPQPIKAPGAGSLPVESGRDTGRMGHCGESAQGRGPRALCYLDAGTAPAVSGQSSGRPSLARRECCAGHTTGDGWADCGGDSPRSGFLKAFALAVIGFYRAAISPALPSSCRFYPTCSEYAYQAVSAWGLRRGLRLTIKRLGRCRPFGPYGYDPVPERTTSTTETTGNTEAVSVCSVSSVAEYSPPAGPNSEVARTEALL